MRAPRTEADPSWREAPSLSDQFAPIGHGAADAPRHQADGVGDVGEHRGVAQGEQGGEGDQRPRPDDDVDGPGRQPGGEDGQGGQRRHGEGLAPGDPVLKVWSARQTPAAPDGPGGNGSPRRDGRFAGCNGIRSVLTRQPGPVGAP